MCTSTDAIKAKISKLLRMQQSDNVSEAANAAAFVEKLCKEHGISPEECSPDYDPDRDVAVYWTCGKPFKRVDHASWSLLSHVAGHFNGTTVSRCIRSNEPGYVEFKHYRTIEVLATKGNQIQIDLYYEYLSEVMDKLADKAKADHEAAGFHGDRAFKRNFRKGFAAAIGEKLSCQRRQQMKEEQQLAPGVNGSLALLKRTEIEKREVTALMNQRYPRLGSGSSGTYGGSGTSAGVAAGRSTSVSKQVTRSSRPALTGY
tara:strand:+ start:39 stop:815 length:777 start_codon:yes stop_codon:yes gene_type:complete